VDYWRGFQCLSTNTFIQQSIHPFSLVLAEGRRRNKKPTTVSSRGFLSKFCLTTSADGVVSYNDYQQSDLSNIL
jgi:hypothetical protein